MKPLQMLIKHVKWAQILFSEFLIIWIHLMFEPIGPEKNPAWSEI